MTIHTVRSVAAGDKLATPLAMQPDRNDLRAHLDLFQTDLILYTMSYGIRVEGLLERTLEMSPEPHIVDSTSALELLRNIYASGKHTPTWKLSSFRAVNLRNYYSILNVMLIVPWTP